MRKFNLTDASGSGLIQEFCLRVVADEYDSYCESSEGYVDESSNEFSDWLNEQSTTLYNEIMESVNNYCDFGGIQEPPVKE